MSKKADYAVRKHHCHLHNRNDLNKIDQRFRKPPFSLSTSVDTIGLRFFVSTMDSIFKHKLCVSDENSGRFPSWYGKTHQYVFAFKRTLRRLLWSKLRKQPQLLLHRHSTAKFLFLITLEPLFSGHLLSGYPYYAASHQSFEIVISKTPYVKPYCNTIIFERHHVSPSGNLETYVTSRNMTL